MRTAGFLIGDAGEDEVALERDALFLEPRDDQRAHDRHVLHVDGAAAPDVAVVDLAAKRRMLPALRLGLDDVEMRGQQERRLLARAFEPRDDVLPLGRLADQLRRKPASRQQVRQIFGGRRLVAGRVGGVDSNERL